MTQPTSFTALRNILASLYPDVESMRRLLADAGIDVARVSFTSSALNNWHAILSEAANLHRLDALIDVALAEYGENPQLQAAVTAYRQAAQASNIEQRSATLDPSPALTTPTPATDIFLSYSRADAATMQRLRADLQAAGFSVWIDDLDLEPGTPSWQRAVEAAIYATRGMVVILSPAAKNSEWVGRELSYAAHLGRRIFPVLVSGDGISAIPLSLINHQRVDLRTGWDGVDERLIPALRRHLGREQMAKEIAFPPPQQTIRKPAKLRWQWGAGVSVAERRLMVTEGLNPPCTRLDRAPAFKGWLTLKSPRCGWGSWTELCWRPIVGAHVDNAGSKVKLLLS